MASGPEHYRRAEALLASCQVTTDRDEDGTVVEIYPSYEYDDVSGRDVNTTGNALLAAQVHAELAKTAALMDLIGATVNGVVTPGWGEALS